jgi:fructose-1,6-bisphosphatase/inositol monophosphatase family enzyme
VLTSSDYRSGDEKRRDAWRLLSDRAAVSRTWGDCYGYLLVATGRADVMADPRMAVWDAAPLLPIIEEAGGVFTDWSGVRTVFGESAIATNTALADEVRALLIGSNPA